MPPKKSKVKSKVVEEVLFPRKVYELLNGADIKVKEQKHANHIKNLNDSLNYVKESSSTVAQFHENLMNLNKWQEYVNCYPFPKSYIPPDIRLLIEKIKYFKNISNKENTMSWRLLIDEHSILTQNFLREDLTISALKLKNEANFGPVYERDINICLKMIQRIDDFLENNMEVGKCGVEKLHDVKELRATLQQEINNFLNQFTYHILSSEETFMNSLDALTCDYNFQSNNFQMHIWALKNVPIRFQQLENQRFIAKLYGVNIILSIPTSIMQENFAIRVLHMNFDHVSKFDQVMLIENIVTPDSGGSFAATDLVECLNNERLMKLEIMNCVRNDLMQIRLEYEEKMQLVKKLELKKKKKLKEEELTKILQRKVQKLMNITREPDFIDADTFPDIQKEFLEEEQKQYENYFYTKYSPVSLNLEADEINLKKYFILGGIYQLYQVQKPEHFDFNHFNMTWHLNNSKLAINEDLVIPLNTIPNRRRSTIYQIETRKTLTVRRSDSNDSPEPECPWFILTIQLPEYLCYWGQPVVCQYETMTKIKTNSLILETNKDLSIYETSLSPDKYLPFLAPQKEGLTNSVLKLQQSSKESFFRTSISNIHVAGEKSPLHECARDLEGVLNISDFYLNSHLSKAQIRQIYRHVLPRIISSFKFDREIQEDELGALRNKGKGKSKTKAGNLIRKHDDADIMEVSANEHLFTFGPKQNIPERLIPIYTQDEPIRLLQLKTDIKESSLINEGVKTFAQLVKLINFIKWWHKVQVRKIIDHKPFMSSYPVVNKRLQALKKQKLKPFFSAISIPPSTPSKIRTKLPQSRSFSKSSNTSKTTFVEPSESDISSTIMKDSVSVKDSFAFKNFISKTNSFESDMNENVKEGLQTYYYSHWTTQNILRSDFNREMHTVVVQTNKLGLFGLAFKQYEHFPFKFWKVEPSENDPENEVIFTVESQHITCIFYINEYGIRCRVTEPTTKFTKNTKIYLSIDEPMSNLKELKKIFQEKYLNIFGDIDARFYIENGYFSEKHLSTELHTYNCIATNSTQIKFIASQWNRLTQRRDIILKFLQYQDSEENTVDVRITPEEAFFVEIDEQCSDNLNNIKLGFHLTWRNIGLLSDLNQLINSVYPTVKEMKCKDAKLLNFVRNLLYEIRPLSFS